MTNEQKISSLVIPQYVSIKCLVNYSISSKLNVILL